MATTRATSRFWARLVAVLAFVGFMAAPTGAAAQPMNSGLNVQPIFEGWTHNDDGSFTLNFGDLNRNNAEHVLVPVVPDNQVEPEGLVRCQPAYFYPRTNRFVCSVRVPKDWGKKEVIWTLKVG